MPRHCTDGCCHPMAHVCSIASSWAAGGEVIPGAGGEGAALDQEQRMQQGPILKGHDGGAEKYNGEALMHEVYDLMRHRLPDLPQDDPYRDRLMRLLPALARGLGRDLLAPVPTRRTGHRSA